MGNESSQQQVKYGDQLDNDITVTWKKTEESAPFPARDGHCAAAVGNKLFVFGGVIQSPDGESTESNDLLVFDLESQTWSQAVSKGDVPAPRSAATLAAVGKQIFLFGGLSQDHGWFEGVHCCDTETNTWTKVAATGTGPSARDKLSSAVIKNDIYLFGGFGPHTAVEEEEVEEFDDEDEEEEVPEDQEGAQFGWFNDIFIFSTETKSWSNPMQMNLAKPTPRAAAAMCSLDKYLFIFGGRDAQGRKNDLHIFDTQSRKWETELKITGRQPEPRSFHTATAVGNRVVVLGGRGVAEQHFKEVHVFDTAARQWLQPSVQGQEFPARGTHSATVVGDHFVVFGGSSNFSPEIMQCQSYFNDTFMIKTDEILSTTPKQSPEGGASSSKSVTGSGPRQALKRAQGEETESVSPAKTPKTDTEHSSPQTEVSKSETS